MAETFCTSIRNTEVRINYVKEVNGKKPFNKLYRGNSKTLKYHQNIQNQDRQTNNQRQFSSNKPTRPPPSYASQKSGQRNSMEIATTVANMDT